METRPWYVNQQVNYAFFDFTEMELYIQFNNVSGVKFSETLNTPSLKGFVYYTSSNLSPSWIASHAPLNNLGNNLYSTLISGTFQLGSVIHTKYIPNSGLPVNGTTFYVTDTPTDYRSIAIAVTGMLPGFLKQMGNQKLNSLFD